MQSDRFKDAINTIQFYFSTTISFNNNNNLHYAVQCMYITKYFIQNTNNMVSFISRHHEIINNLIKHYTVLLSIAVVSYYIVAYLQDFAGFEIHRLAMLHPNQNPTVVAEVADPVRAQPTPRYW